MFPLLVGESPFHYWRLGDPIESRGERVLVGVFATFNLVDMRVLDILVEHAEVAWIRETRIDVFDLHDVPDWTTAARYFPRLPAWVPSPIVGVWEAGVHQRNLTGGNAIDYLLANVGVFTSTKAIAESVRPPAPDIL
jgi:hypothetical protein